MKGLVYPPLRFVVMIVIAIVFLAVFFMSLKGGTSPALDTKQNPAFCSTDADCSEGVCVGGDCACFLDLQCKTSGKCDMGTGICKK